MLVDDVPEGTNWIANAATGVYYRVGCPVTASIPDADRLYYKSEASLRSAGFAKSDECNATRFTRRAADSFHRSNANRCRIAP